MADVVMKIDDLDGTPIPDGKGGAVTFAFRGKSYKIDLTDKNAETLAEMLAPYISKATEIDPEEAEEVESAPELPQTPKQLILEMLTKKRAKELQAEAERLLAVGKKPYDTTEARRWLGEQGIPFNQMGPLKKEFREIYEQAFGLPAYDSVLPQAASLKS